jgi:hypothetical protein
MSCIVFMIFLWDRWKVHNKCTGRVGEENIKMDNEEIISRVLYPQGEGGGGRKQAYRDTRNISLPQPYLVRFFAERKRRTIHSPKFFSISVIYSMCKCRGLSSFVIYCKNILQYMTKYRDTYTYITEIEKNLGECSAVWREIWNGKLGT